MRFSVEICLGCCEIKEEEVDLVGWDGVMEWFLEGMEFKWILKGNVR